MSYTKYLRINNRQEFKDFYPYKSPPNPEPCPTEENYPLEYPCFCKLIYVDGGLGGDYTEVEIIYPPKGIDLTGFEAGINCF